MTTIDYTSRDFKGLRQSLLEYAERAFPDWRPGSEGDFGVLLLELLAYVGDVNSYYVDRAQREAYLSTASQPESIYHIASMLGYVPHSGTPATGLVLLKNTDTDRPLEVPEGTLLTSTFDAGLDAEMLFETDYPVVVAPNTEMLVAVTEGETKQDPITGGPLTLGTSDGVVGQRFRLPHALVYRDTVRVWVAGEQWREVTHLLDGGPEDKVFSTRTDPHGFTWVEFGDGLNGAIPSIGLDIAARYRVGYGSRGNIPAREVVGIYQGNLPGLSVNYTDNAGEFTGGSDPESVEEVRKNAPLTARTRNRAVTLEDFRNLALAVPGVTHASALAKFWSSVSLFITGPDGSVPSDSLIDDVRQFLEERVLTGVSVTVSGPDLIAINVGKPSAKIAVEALPIASNTQVQYDVEQAIKAALSPSAVEFGQRLTVSWLYKVIMDVPGVRFVHIGSLNRADSIIGGPDDAPTNTADIVLHPWEFPIPGELFVSTSGGLG